MPREVGANILYTKDKPATFHNAAAAAYTITLDLPPDTLHGTQIVVAGAGGPVRENGGRGNLIVLVRVKMPGALRE